MARAHKPNGRRRQIRQVNDRKSVQKARMRLLTYAREKGSVNNSQAKRLLGLPQAYYHLNKLAEAGVLKRTDYDEWTPVKRRGRPSQQHI